MIQQHNFLLYTAPDGAVNVDVCLKDETVWLSQKALAELFGVKVPAINKHLKNIFGSGELVESSVVSILEITASDRKNHQTRHAPTRGFPVHGGVCGDPAAALRELLARRVG